MFEASPGNSPKLVYVDRASWPSLDFKFTWVSSPRMSRMLFRSWTGVRSGLGFFLLCVRAVRVFRYDDIVGVHTDTHTYIQASQIHPAG